MKKYSKPNVEMLNFTAEDSIMDIISASGGLFYGNSGDEGSFGNKISIGSFLDI